MKREEFIATIKGSCVTAQQAWGIPWGWFVAQAIQESGGYGLSELSTKAFNLYGIKGKDYYQGVTGYAKFKDWNAAIQFQGWQLSVPRYLAFKGLVQKGDFEAYGNAIQRAGWCAPSDPPYGALIEQIAKEYDLLPKPASTPQVTPQPSVAQQWAVEKGIFTTPVDWDKPVTYNILAWALMKAQGGKI
jgi:flagellum-specific peptidoglycan hydrolase FlgJ